MKPQNKRAAKCHMELWENKHYLPSSGNRIARRFWKRQASKAGRSTGVRPEAEAFLQQSMNERPDIWQALAEPD